MKKSWVLGAVLGVAMCGSKVSADGSFVAAPGPVVAATGQNYYYPSAASPTAGGQLVNDGSLTFRWSNASITSTTSLTVLQFPALPSITTARLQALQSPTTGQVVFCNDCASGGGKGAVCVSSGTTAVGQFILSTGTVCN